MVAHRTRGELGQGSGWGLVPRFEVAPEDPVWGGGFPQPPGGCDPWGEHGVGPPEVPWAIPFWAGGCFTHFVIVPTFEDCTPDLGRRPLAVCRWETAVVVRRVDVGGREGSVTV